MQVEQKKSVILPDFLKPMLVSFNQVKGNTCNYIFTLLPSLILLTTATPSKIPLWKQNDSYSQLKIILNYVPKSLSLRNMHTALLFEYFSKKKSEHERIVLMARIFPTHICNMNKIEYFYFKSCKGKRYHMRKCIINCNAWERDMTQFPEIWKIRYSKGLTF